MEDTYTLVNGFYMKREKRFTSCVTRELGQTTTATATGTSPNKRFDKQNNSYARALKIFEHFVAVLCQTTT